MQRFIAHSLAALGFLIASAIMDLGPRAEAAYQPVGTHADSGLDAPDGAGMAAADEKGDAPEAKPDHEDPMAALYADCCYAQGDGGGAGATSSSASGSGPTSPVAGLVPPTDLPPPNLVAHIQTPYARLALARFVGFILDPPRTS